MEEGKKEVQSKSAVDVIWSFFSSMRLGIILLIILTFFSIYGSLIPFEEALDRVYKSWWFIGGLVITSLNLIICSINRFGTIWKNITQTKMSVGEKWLRSLTSKEIFTYKNEDIEASKIEDFFKNKGFRTDIKEIENGTLVYADKGRFGYLGSMVTHLSIVVILLAGLYGIIAGFEGFDGGFPGRIFSVPQEGFDVRVNDFYIDYRDDKSIEQYNSDLSVLENGQEIKRTTIFVNRPLRYKGVAIYQSTYGWGTRAKVTDNVTGESKDVVLTSGQTQQFQLGEQVLHVRLLDFLPDFTMSPQGQPFSRSAYPGNPYAIFMIYNANGQAVGGRPYYLSAMNEEQPIPEMDDLSIAFVDFDNYSGFRFVKDPGRPIAFIGSVLMVLGLIMSFYLFPRRFWALVTKEDDESTVLIAGKGFRNKVGFELEFKRTIEKFKKMQEE